MVATRSKTVHDSNIVASCTLLRVLLKQGPRFVRARVWINPVQQGRTPALGAKTANFCSAVRCAPKDPFGADNLPFGSLLICPLFTRHAGLHLTWHFAVVPDYIVVSVNRAATRRPSNGPRAMANFL